MGGCHHRPTYRIAQGGVWNTLYHITYSSDRDMSDSILAVMKRVEMSLSPFAKSSLISAINRGESATTDTLLRRVFEESMRINGLSHGAFDPTVSPLINLWGFGYTPGDDEPSQQAIDSLLAFVGIDGCRLTEQGEMLKKHPATEFNFSAITKGYGCDLVGEMLRRNGIKNYLVEIGGEIVARGMNPKGEAWRVQIDAPIESDTAPLHNQLAVITVSNCAMATSGNYRNFRETGAGKVWHTISPVTGRPALTDLLSATVIAPECITADALATSCMAMPADSAMAMIESIADAEALLITADTVLTTKGFPIPKSF